MSRSIYKIAVLLFLLLLAGCMQDDTLELEGQQPDGGKVLVRFTALIPQYNTLQTRAGSGVQLMYILVIDENGTYITREKATLTNQTGSIGTFTANLPTSDSKRTVHFVCNMDLENVPMRAMSEAEAVGLLTSTDGVFWARKELPGGIAANSFTAGSPIILLRNQAKLSIINEAANFTLQGFTVHNRADRGKVAPFNKSIGQFEERAITEASDAVLIAALESEIDESEKYLFERNNRFASEIATVIVKGVYENNTYFYKVDLLGSQLLRMNIERNYHYVIKIKGVAAAGYTTFGDALVGNANNNALLDPSIQKYPIISDGVGKLEVERTLVIFTEAGKTIDLDATYTRISDGVVDNSDVVVSLLTNNGALSNGGLTYNRLTGKMSLTSGSTVPAGDDSKGATILVVKGALARTIRVVLGAPFEFFNLKINNQNPALLGYGQNVRAELDFTIPNGFPTDLFPMPIRIYTNGLYPTEEGLLMSITETGDIYYTYTATKTGLQEVSFKTNKAGGGETVRLIEPNYFVEAAIDYEAIHYEGNVTFGPNNSLVPIDATLLQVSRGELALTADGRYTYHPPAGSESTTAVTFTYSVQTSGKDGGAFIEAHEKTTTIGALRDGTIHLPRDRYIIRGDISNSGLYWGLSNGANVSVRDNKARVTVSSGSRYELVTNGVLAENQVLQLSNRFALLPYSNSFTIASLRGDQEINMRVGGNN